MNPRFTLGQVFVFNLLGLVLLLGFLFYAVLTGSQQSILESSERLRSMASQTIADRVRNYLSQAEGAWEKIENQIKHGTIDPQNPLSLESGLFSALLSDKNLAELTLTYGKPLGYDDKGFIQLAKNGRGQISAYRVLQETGSPENGLLTRSLHFDGQKFASELRRCPPNENFLSAPLTPEKNAHVADPTQHLTFKTPARLQHQKKLLWSDLHPSQLDSHLPKDKQRVMVSLQKSVLDANGEFVGVLRAGLLTDQIDLVTRLKLDEADPHDPHTVFISDNQGRLITRLAPSDPLQELEDAYRIIHGSMSPEIAMALQQPVLKKVTSSNPLQSSRFQSDGREYLATFRDLGGMQDWLVGIVVPEDYYLGKLKETRRRLLFTSLAIIAGIALGGGLILRSVKRAQTRIVSETSKMNRFEFSPSSCQAPFADVRDVLESLEKAKTAMRAMGKYAPIDLVRQLYREKSEPVLGGQLAEVSIMFTDIRNFTTFSEELSPNRLAEALGKYLEVMAHVIQHETSGVIDKYIGDAVMAIWNAPNPVKDHAQMACRAALSCLKAEKELCESPTWQGLPIFQTRFGLHRDKVMVGHFGAPSRMNYTAIGDGVNLASRLEALNKQYDSSIIVSQNIHENAGDHFEFRLLDWVAVKGKRRGIKIYELLEEKGEADGLRPVIANYEKAFENYLDRKFKQSVSLLEKQLQDGPSRALLERCEKLLKDPPPASWSGVHPLTSK